LKRLPSELTKIPITEQTRWGDVSLATVPIHCMQWIITNNPSLVGLFLVSGNTVPTHDPNTDTFDYTRSMWPDYEIIQTQIAGGIWQHQSVQFFFLAQVHLKLVVSAAFRHRVLEVSTAVNNRVRICENIEYHMLVNDTTPESWILFSVLAELDSNYKSNHTSENVVDVLFDVQEGYTDGKRCSHPTDWKTLEGHLMVVEDSSEVSLEVGVSKNLRMCLGEASSFAFRKVDHIIDLSLIGHNTWSKLVCPFRSLSLSPPATHTHTWGNEFENQGCR